MPIYAYKCESCGHAKDVLQKMSDPLLTDCPACGAATFQKQLTSAGFQLKGSGWYVTDFRGDNAAKAKEESKADGKSDLGATDGKPATPAEKPGGSAGETSTAAPAATTVAASASAPSVSSPVSASPAIAKPSSPAAA